MTLLPKVFDITEEELVTAVPGYCYRLPVERVGAMFMVQGKDLVESDCLYRLSARVYPVGHTATASIGSEMRPDGCRVLRAWAVPVKPFAFEGLSSDEVREACESLVAQSSPDIPWERAALDEYPKTSLPYRRSALEPVAA